MDKKEITLQGDEWLELERTRKVYLLRSEELKGIHPIKGKDFCCSIHPKATIQLKLDINGNIRPEDKDIKVIEEYVKCSGFFDILEWLSQLNTLEQHFEPDTPRTFYIYQATKL